MAKEDFCFTYYDGDAARDKAHMNRLERGGYDDIITSQRKFGHLPLKLIKKTLGSDFEIIWDALEIILKKDETGSYYIEWLEISVKKMKSQSKHQYENGKKGGRPAKPKQNPNETQTITQTYDKKKPLEDENGDGNENGVFGKSGNLLDPPDEIPTAFQMSQKFTEVNPDYPVKPGQDYPAIMDIANFLNQQTGGKHEIEKFTGTEQRTVLAEWTKWCYWYRDYGDNKSLDYLARFKMQQIYSEIKNGNGNNSAGFKKGKYQISGTGGY